MKDLILDYSKKKRQIKQRLSEFKNLYRARNKDIFSELCFCILTPQSKAIYCDKAIKELKKTGLLFVGNRNAIKEKLKGMVRFHNNKATYLVAARKFFSAQGGSTSGEKNGRGLDIKSKLNAEKILETREWLVRNIKGLGYKEASHFLRNIGLGKNIAIIDRHILKNLKRYGVVKEIPASIGKRNYLAIEKAMGNFSRQTKIPMRELDLLFWSKQTGFVFK